jgi:hypothetical protein
MGLKGVLFVDDETAKIDGRLRNAFHDIKPLSLADLTSQDAIVSRFRNYFGPDLPAHVLCCNDLLGLTYCRIMRDLTSRCKQATALARSYLKHRLRSALFEAKVDDLQFHKVMSDRDIDDFCDLRSTAEFGQWILKPTVGTASELVSIRPLGTPDAIWSAWRDFIGEPRRCEGLLNWCGHSWGRVAVLEKCIDGDEFTVEGLVDEGDIQVVGICKKKCGLTADAGARSEGANYSPPDIDFSQVIKIKKYVEDVVRVSELERCAFHIELRWDSHCDCPRLIELNPRLPGGLQCQIHRDVTGIDLHDGLLRILLNKPLVRNPPTGAGVYGYVPLVPLKTGTYRGYKGTDLLPDDLRSRIRIEPLVQPGSPVNPRPREAYFADVYLLASTHDDFFRDAELIRSCIMAEVDCDPH